MGVVLIHLVHSSERGNKLSGSRQLTELLDQLKTPDFVGGDVEVDYNCWQTCRPVAPSQGIR